MRILYLTPSYVPTISGNATDIYRLVEGFAKRNIAIEVMTTEGRGDDEAFVTEIAECVRRFKPNLIHAFHSYKSRVVREVARRAHLPYVMTLTGTDINLDFADARKRTQILQVLSEAKFVTALSESMKNVVLSASLSEISVICKGEPMFLAPTTAATGSHELPGAVSGRDLFPGLAKDDFLFLLVGGIRPVKNSLFPIQPLRELGRSHPKIKLLFLGPVLDEEYWLALKKEIDRESWLIYGGTVGFEAIRSAYLRADVVVNCSFSEGASNVVFEAMCLQRPLLVSDIPGNLQYVTHGFNGLVFNLNSAADFAAKARLLYADSQLRDELARHARQSITTMVNKKEIDEYLGLYEKICRTF